MSPLNDVSTSCALPSPRRRGGCGAGPAGRPWVSPERTVTGRSERTLPLNVPASTSNPVAPASARLMSPDCDLNS